MNEPILQSILSGARKPITYGHPIVGLKEGDTKGQEMLTRFQDDQGRMLTAGTLLADPGLPARQRVELDLVCLGAVFQGLARNPITDHLVFVNLNPLTLEHPDFWKRIQAWVWELPIPPHRVVLELTESFAVHDLDQLEGFARRLREIGLRLAVDDLGSGVASLSHMARLAPDFIKVDRSLVRDVHRRPYQAALLNALALFAERMRVGCIAEGIETIEELQAVIDADVPWGQGFIFGQPEPLRLPQAL